jgi:hypothetical protein
MSALLSRMMMLSEGYPELKANGNGLIGAGTYPIECIRSARCGLGPRSASLRRSDTRRRSQRRLPLAPDAAALGGGTSTEAEAVPEQHGNGAILDLRAVRIFAQSG